MARILIVYGTRHGQTARIAHRVAESLRGSGNDVDAFDLRASGPPPAARGYDAVVVGASVHAGGYEREVREWVRARVDDLRGIPNWFFSVSLASANHDDQSAAEIDAAVEAFTEDTGWRPARVEKIAGALVYSKYNWFLRRVMRRIVRRKSGGPYTDMSRDYDLTDYDQVDRFAHDIAEAASRWASTRT